MGNRLRALFLAALVLAIWAGPMDAACSSCCPSPPETTSVGAPGCCGEPCGATLERPDAERAASGVERSSFDLAISGAALTSPAADLLAGSLSLTAFDLPPPVFSSLSSPLRL